MYSLTEFSEKTGIKLEKLEKQIREDKNFWNERVVQNPPVTSKDPFETDGS